MTKIEIDKYTSLLLRADLEEIINEDFAIRYSINVENWIFPELYYSQKDKKLIYNKIPDNGLYCLLGKVNYPGDLRFSSHCVFQYNLVRIRGLECLWADKFRGYPGVPEVLKDYLTPYFPLFKVGDIKPYKKYFKMYYEDLNRPKTVDDLKSYIYKLQTDDFKDLTKIRIYKLRLALQRLIDKEKW